MSKFLKKFQQKGILSILSTKNNTILTLTDEAGNTKFATSAGLLGFKNSRKSTPYAAQAAAEHLVSRALQLGFHCVEIRMKGLGYGKQNSLRSLLKSPLQITRIQEQTPLAHNGCRAPKKRRI